MLDSQEGAASPCAPAARYCLNTSSLVSGDQLLPAPQTPALKRSAEPAQALQGFVMPWRTRKKPRRSQMRQFESPCCVTVGPLTTNSAQIKPSITRSKTAPQCLQKVVMLSWWETVPALDCALTIATSTAAAAGRSRRLLWFIHCSHSFLQVFFLRHQSTQLSQKQR